MGDGTGELGLEKGNLGYSVVEVDTSNLNGDYLKLESKFASRLDSYFKSGQLTKFSSNGDVYLSADQVVHTMSRSPKREYKYSIMELRSHDKIRHISVDDAYKLIDGQKDEGLQVEKLKAAVEVDEIKVYEFGGTTYFDRLDIGRVYNKPKKREDGLTIERHFSTMGEDPFKSVGEYHNVKLHIEKKGHNDFLMEEANFPKTWENMIANNIVGDKYFFKPTNEDWKSKLIGKIGKDHEYSPVHTINRITNFIASEGFKLGYFNSEEDRDSFADELKWLQINRRFAFNSPVNFNFGLHNEYGIEGGNGINYFRDPKSGEVTKVEQGCYVHPQGHACFIKGPKDDLESILKHMVDEGAIFSSGSGVGQNIGVLRGDGEALSGGGVASGGLSFLSGYDKNAGTIKSGGKSRRAARWTGMDYNHKDIMQFIRAKVKEDKKCLDLMKMGYETGMDGEAARTVAYQNTNVTVRADEDFFKAVELDGMIKLRNVSNGKVVEEVSAREMLKEIAFGSWRIGDPALQYITEIDRMHTCPNSGKQQATNPCSEYLFLDDTSCNLLSHNLVEYADEEGNLNVKDLSRAYVLTSFASDIINDIVSYPVKDIAYISPEFRTQGVGNCNVGALLMRKGLAYDSDKGRALIGGITALMTGKVYEASIQVSEKLGPFIHYEFNKKPFMDVMKIHQKNLKDVDWRHIDDKGLKEASYETWKNVIHRGNDFGFRNAQATVYAPTGTIAFLMHADTTGIEPAYALKIFKELAGGGNVEIVNLEVPNALKNLKYKPSEIEDIIGFIDRNRTVVGSPHVRPDHYPVFDTADGDGEGNGVIDFEGHVKMLGAAQPFVSGAISKTCNLPESATVKNIYDSYLLGRKLGLKALAVFRAESKPTSALKRKPEEFVILKRGEKEELPYSGDSFTQRIKIGGVPLLINIGEYPDGRPGEIVIESFGSRSELGEMYKLMGISASKALKRGVHIDDVVSGWINYKSDPHGMVNIDSPVGPHPFIKQALSSFDFLGRCLLLNYRGRVDLATEPDEVDITLLRGYTHGAFRTYKDSEIDDWNFGKVMKDPELGGFEKDKKNKLLVGKIGKKKKEHTNDRGVTCGDCGSLMQQTSPSCFMCNSCGDKRGGCGL